jgi:hypothetical protein
MTAVVFVRSLALLWLCCRVAHLIKNAETVHLWVLDRVSNLRLRFGEISDYGNPCWQVKYIPGFRL